MVTEIFIVNIFKYFIQRYIFFILAEYIRKKKLERSLNSFDKVPLD